jgi:hypothetical protein
LVDPTFEQLLVNVVGPATKLAATVVLLPGARILPLHDVAAEIVDARMAADAASGRTHGDRIQNASIGSRWSS